MANWKFSLLFSGIVSGAAFKRAVPDYNKLDDCPGYAASNIQQSDDGLTADLKLAGPACDAYGDDLTDLVLSVTYQTGNSLFPQLATRSKLTV
jgi:alpha-glucosidase